MGQNAPWPIRARNPGQNCPEQRPTSRLVVAPIVRQPLPLSSLRTYDKCPRRYLYQYGYQLYDDHSPYLRMHQAIRQVVAELVELARAGQLPTSEEELDALIYRVMAQRSLLEEAYAGDYRAETARHVRRVWSDVRAGAVPDSVEQTFRIKRPGGTIAVRVDQVERGPGGERWVRVRSGAPRDADADDLMTAAYLLAQHDEGLRSATVVLYYTATGESREVRPDPRAIERHTRKLDQLLASLHAGNWEAKPSGDCAVCPFNLICPG